MCLTGKARIIHVKDVPTLGRDDPPPGVIRAFRAWKLEGGRLRSTFKTSTWEPGKPMSAHSGIKADQLQVGVHAVKELRDVHLVAGSELDKKSAVVGEVLLWGD